MLVCDLEDCSVLCAAQIQLLKHTISKGDKKKKKDVAAQIAVLESELEARHEQEFEAFREKDGSTAVSFRYTLSYDVVVSMALPTCSNGVGSDSILCLTCHTSVHSDSVL